MQPSKPCTPLTLDEPLMMPLHPTQERLLQYMLALGHGVIEIKVMGGLPVMVERALEQTKLT
jgi:hypothetical protein